MGFNINSPILFLLVAVIVAAVLGQSVFFLIKAWKRGQKIGMPKEKLKKIAKTASVFTIAPAIAIVISVITLSKDLGLPLPWLRLSVVGSLSYETIAASNAEGAMGLVFGQVASLTASQYITVAAVMTVSILLGIWLVPIVCKRVLGGMVSMEGKDKKWGEIFMNAMFIGMISAFVGYVFCDLLGVFSGDLRGLIPVLVMFVSAIIMALCGLVKNKMGWRWIADYALPISLILGMASAIPITAMLS